MTRTDSIVKLLIFSSKLLKLVSKKVASTKTKLVINEGPFVEPAPGVQCSGFFSPQEGLHIAIGKPISQWVTVLAHEYCHLLQWRKSAKVWKDVEFSIGKDSFDSSTVIDEWLGGKEFSEEVLDRAFDAIISLELDCERRTALLLKKLKAPIDIEEYTQKANSYVLFYRECRKTRKWYDPLSPPYEQKEIWSKMPSTFQYNIEDVVYPMLDVPRKYDEVFQANIEDILA
jgi:hypothetical protein